ncbi:hypothetical protein FACS189441_5350 [Betaproteobacteria bacterium]|nr:hypothetical protein FACS189441_5350 [Betaproteobacteria bacterium]
MKSWTYAEITEHAEAVIKIYMKSLLEAKSDGEKDLYRAMASGAYNFWYAMTGKQEDGGDARLTALWQQMEQIR